MRSISWRDLRRSSGRVLRDLAAGAELLVSSNGKPISVLRVDPPPTERQRFVTPEQYAAGMGDSPALTADQQQAWLEDSRMDDEGCAPSTPA